MPTTVGHISTRQPGDVYVGRAGHGEDGYFGNPFRLTHETDRERVLAQYQVWFARRVTADPEFRARLRSIQGKRLVCFCAPRRCHADVIAAFLNN